MIATKPYTKAIFALALRDQQLLEWKNTLAVLAAAVIECKKIGCKQELDFFCDISKSFPMAINLLRLLAERKKLETLPDIALEFQQLLFEHEKTLEAKVITTCELSIKQKEKLTKALQQRYQQQILLRCQIDNKLIGGAVVYIAGQIIDGSIKGMLQRLKQSL